ncbi:histidine kinase [Gordonia sinesedis]
MWRVPVSRRRLDDIGLTLLFAAIGVGIYLAGFDSFGDLGAASLLPDWWALVALGCASAFQLLRSSHPGIALAGTTVILAVGTVALSSILTWLVYSDIVYAVCVYGSARLVRVLYGVVTIVAVTAFTLAAAADPDWRVIFVTVLWIVALLVSPLAYGQAVREHRNALDAERERAQAVSELAERARAEAVADERRRLARELHDVIAGRLSSIAMHSSVALTHEDDVELVGRALRSVRESSVGALDEMREMIDLLSDTTTTGRQSATDPDHSTSTLRRLDRLVGPIRAGGTDIRLSGPAGLTGGGELGLAAVTDIAAYRIVAESLTNAITHAPGAPISVDIAIDGGTDTGADSVSESGDRRLRIRIANPATDVGDRSDREHRGIGNMVARAEAVGGWLRAARVGREFVVTAELPAVPARSSDPRTEPPGSGPGRTQSSVASPTIAGSPP